MKDNDEIELEVDVAEHFEELVENWEYKTYLAVGGYGSGKSYDMALKIVIKLSIEKRKCLVVRKVYATLRDSTFALFKDVISSIGLPSGMIKESVSPLGIKFSNGSEIVFKGLDDKEKIKSIHNISIIWIEESSELHYADYKELLGRARHPSDSIHFLLTSNPVGDSNWIYKHFFVDDTDTENIRVTLDDKDLYRDRVIVKGDTYYHHSTAEDNPFLPKSYIEQLDELEGYDPDLHRVARKGEFGVTGTRVLPQFEAMGHKEVMQSVDRIPRQMKKVGMDFGFVTSYNAVVRVAIDHDNKFLYIYSEYYSKGLTDDRIVEDLKEFRESRELIVADSSEPKTIEYFNQQGFRMVGAKKGAGSVLEGIRKIKRFKRIICSSSCKDAIRELENLTYARDRNDNVIEDELSIDAHILDAIRYSLEDYQVSDLKGNTINFLNKSSLF